MLLQISSPQLHPAIGRSDAGVLLALAAGLNAPNANALAGALAAPHH